MGDRHRGHTFSGWLWHLNNAYLKLKDKENNSNRTGWIHASCCLCPNLTTRFIKPGDIFTCFFLQLWQLWGRICLVCVAVSQAEWQQRAEKDDFLCSHNCVRKEKELIKDNITIVFMAHLSVSKSDTNLQIWKLESRSHYSSSSI